MHHDHSYQTGSSASHGCGCSGHNALSRPDQVSLGQIGGGVAGVTANQQGLSGSSGCCGGGQSVAPSTFVELQTVQNKTAPRYWKTIEEYESDPAFLARAQKEFAPGAEWWLDQPSRREFLKGMGASFALAGLTGCTIRQPEEKIMPYVNTPENLIPGKAQFFATAMPQPGGAVGVLVESHDGRPTHIEGNPLHPASGGAADSVAIASVLGLYDPLRTKFVFKKDIVSSWTDFERELEARLTVLRAAKGAGLSLLIEEVLSPTLQEQIKNLLALLPEAKLYQYDSWKATGAVEGAKLAFGTDAVARYDFDKADVILSVGADFLAEGPNHLRQASGFAKRRVVNADGSANMNRLYQVETTPTQTGTKADHWLRLPPAEVAAILVAVAAKLGLDVGGENRIQSVADHEKWIAAAADDLKAAKGKSLVIVGPQMPAEIHALAHVINSELGNVGQTVTFVPPVSRIEGVNPGSLTDLVREIDAGSVGTLFVFACDPVFTSSTDLKLAEKLKKVPCSVYYGMHQDTTSKVCHWTIPATHYLEQWSDARAEDGTISIVQPLIRPLYDGRSVHEIVNFIAGVNASGYDTVRAYWAGKLDSNDSLAWEKVLHDGVVKDTAFAPVSVTVAGSAVTTLKSTFNVEPAKQSDTTVVFRLDGNIFDGRYSTNGWLQEAPQPLSRLTWGNTAWIAPSTAKELGVKSRDLINIQKGNATVAVPAWVQPGQPKGVITLTLGHGREVEGHKVVGVDVNSLRDTNSPWVTSAKISVTGKKAVLAETQEYYRMDGRDLVRFGTLKQVQDHPEKPSFMDVGHHHPGGHHDHDDKDDGHDHDKDISYGEGPGATFFPNWPMSDDPQWGMTINLGACTGCNACIVACQSENNIPVVGADQVGRGREMHWLRIDTYFVGDVDQPDAAYHQPVACMHCEHAPCEPVCPVGATTHSSEGLNEMTYNRCIGTRYCSNNCPYKARRFNFLAYNEQTWQLPVLQMAENPNVSVRSRGVMEKCTYCVQRISSARIQAKMENRDIRDGEITTACQSVCAANAITFGNVADESSAVHKMKTHPLNYGILTDLNTRPRTSYLAAVRNPNPTLVTVETEAHHEAEAH